MARILVVEDSRLQALDLERTMRDAGFEVELAGDGESALSMLRREPFDLVVSDIVMPGISGFELCRRIKRGEAGSVIPVILLTAATEPLNVLEAMEAGADNFVPKPYVEKPLVARVLALLGPRASREEERLQIGIDLTFMDRRFTLSPERRQFVNIFLSSLEDAVRSNVALRAREKELAEAKLALEGYARRLEGQVKLSDERYSALVEQANDAILVMDPRGVVLDANRRAQCLFGRPREAILGHDHVEFFDPEEREVLRSQFAELLEEGHALSEAVAVQRPDGTLVPVEYSASVVHHDDHRATLHILRDVSERTALQEQLLQSQKMEAVGLLAGGIAHDFNNFLTAILGYTEVLLTERASDAGAVECLQLIRRATLRATSLSTQLLVFSRKQVTTPRVVDINQSVVNTERMLQRMIGEDITLTLKVDPAIWKIRADPAQIEQVLLNLGVNARDAMPSGGELSLETSNVMLDERHVREHPDARPGPHVLLAVADTGSGIEPQIRSRIFEPFFTTKPRGRGTGLGLSMVFGIVTQGGGHIVVESEVGLGSVFKIYLPSVTEAIQAGEGCARAEAAPRGAETILVVEDEEVVRNLIRRILRSAGYSVISAQSGVEAIDAVEKRSGPIHLLLSDVVMPNMSGPELVDRIRQQMPKLKFLYMSGYTNHQAIAEGVLSQGIPLLQKPFPPSDLLANVREILDR